MVMDDFKFLQHLENKKQNYLLLDIKLNQRPNLNKIFTLLLLFLGCTESHRAMQNFLLSKTIVLKKKDYSFFQTVSLCASDVQLIA